MIKAHLNWFSYKAEGILRQYLEKHLSTRSNRKKCECPHCHGNFAENWVFWNETPLTVMSGLRRFEGEQTHQNIGHNSQDDSGLQLRGLDYSEEG